MNHAYGRRLFAVVICHTTCSFWSIFSRTFSSSKATHPCPKGCGHWSGTTTLFETEGCSFSCFKSKRVRRGQGAGGFRFMAVWWEWRRSYDMYVYMYTVYGFIFYVYLYMCFFIYNLTYRKSSSRRSKQAKRTTTSSTRHIFVGLEWIQTWWWKRMKKAQGLYIFFLYVIYVCIYHIYVYTFLIIFGLYAGHEELGFAVRYRVEIVLFGG